MIIEIPVIFGDSSQMPLLFPILDKVKMQLMQVQLSDCGPGIERIVVLLCFSGEIVSFPKKGVVNRRIELKRKRVAIDFCFEDVNFENAQFEIVRALKLSIESIAEGLQDRKGLVDFNVDRFHSDVSQLLDSFLE